MLMEVSIVGQVAGGSGFGGGGSAHCLWRVVAESGWTHTCGALSGASQSDLPADDHFVWQHPVDCSFECTPDSAEQTAWPRIEVEVRSRDGYDRSDLSGYGVVAVPPSPGLHHLVCRIWRPRGSLGDRVTAFFLGGRPHLKDSKLVFGISEGLDSGGQSLARAVGDHRLLTEPAGTVNINLAVHVQRRFSRPGES